VGEPFGVQGPPTRKIAEEFFVPAFGDTARRWGEVSVKSKTKKKKRSGEPSQTAACTAIFPVSLVGDRPRKRRRKENPAQGGEGDQHSGLKG